MTRMVHCSKYDETLPGLEYPPFKGALGRRIYETVSQKAWKAWLGQSTMVINENRLNPSESEAQHVLQEQLEAFLFGGGVAKPAGYKPVA